MKRLARLVLFFAMLAPLSAALAAPPGRLVRVGLLYPIVPDFNPAKNAFDKELVQGLRELGYVQGRNIAFEFRSGAGVNERLTAFAAELAASDVEMIVAPGTQAVLDLAKATKTKPIIMVGTTDAVETGVIASLARPGGNVTGLAVNAAETAAKRVQLLRDAVPGLTRVAVLWNSSIQSMTLGFHNIEQAAPKLGLTLQSVQVSSSQQFELAFDALARSKPQGLIVLFGPLKGNDLPRIVEFVVEHRIPTIFEPGQGVRGGGLMEFGPSQAGMARRAGAYIDKIANGANPATLPVEEPTVFELVINLQAAKRMGITIPTPLLLRADRVVIE